MEIYEGYQKHTTKELCEAFNIGVSAFKHKAKKEAAFNKIRRTHELIIEKSGRSNFYYTKEKQGFLNLLNCDIGDKNPEIFKNILNIIIEGKIVPVQNEFARVSGVSQSTISDYIKFMKTQNILVAPIKATSVVIHNETGEILSEDERNIGTHICYDIRPDGTYEMLSIETQKAVDTMYKKEWAIAGSKMAVIQQKYAIQGADMKRFKINTELAVWSKVNKTFNLNDGQRKMPPIINPNIVFQLKEYFKCEMQGAS